jgi:PKD repeat protein/flagellar hook assembly protein FlgD
MVGGFFLSLYWWAEGSAAQGTIALKITPAAVLANTPTVVTFQATIPADANLLPTSPNLLRLNGGTAVNLGRMYDDGTNGDAVAGDGVYTRQATLNEAVPTTLSFRVSVAYKGQLKRVLSDPATLTVIGQDKTPPTLSLNPANGTTVNTTAPLIEIGYTDDSSGVDLTSLAIRMDGVERTALFQVTATKATYLAPLAGGQHLLEVALKDKAGNQAQAMSRFTISSFRSLPDATPTSGPAPLAVTFITRAENTDANIIRYRWDFQGDGVFDTDDPGARNYSRTFTQTGIFNAVLEVSDDKNRTVTATVKITVTGNPPVATARIDPSNGPVPLAVNFTGSGTDRDGRITKFEWDFQGDGVFDFSSATTGNTTFTYATAGTYNAVFRVTDNDGLTGTAVVAATAVRVGPPGSPTATITSPANPVTGNTPLTVSFNGTGKDADGTITKYEWDFNGDGVYDSSSPTSAAVSFRYESPGTFVVAFRVTDNAGLTGVDTVVVTVNLPVTLTIPNETCRPLQGGTVAINTTQAGTVPLTLAIRNRTGTTVRTLVNNVTRASGSYTDTWDCKGDNGQVVPEEVYYAVLQYTANGQVLTLDQSRTTGGVLGNPDWRMSTVKGTSCFACKFSPLEDNFLKVDFDLPRAAEVSVSIRLFNRVDEVVSLFDRKLFGRGTFTEFWDGTDGLGRIVTPPVGETFLWGMTSFTLPNNAIFVEVAPQLTEVAAEPNYFNPATGNFLTADAPTTKASFKLSRAATVSLLVFRTGTNRLVRTISKANLPAGNGAIEWDGRNDAGIFVAKGDYRLLLRATDAAGNQSIPRPALVRVFY